MSYFGTFPKIVIFEEKHGSRYFLANSEDDVHNICHKIIKDRVEDGYWYSGEDYAAAKNVLAIGPSRRSYWFLDSRSSGQYEGFYIEDLETV